MNARIPSLKRCVAALVGLVVLLVASVVLSQIRLGGWNPVLAIVIAVAKASIVVTVFMRPGEGGPSARFALAFGIAWVGILIALTLSDFLTRS
jgi:cytochrome c oxidase subunit 4